MTDQEHDPWIGRCVRFAFGATFGALVGLYWGEGAWQVVVSVALVCGILAALLGDQFWEHVGWW